MTSNFNKFFLIFCILLVSTPFSQSQNSTLKDCGDFFSKNNVKGLWKNPNGCGVTKIHSLDSIELGLVSMQIWVLARGVPDKNDCMKLNLYLVRPTDLGRGGMMLAWDNFALDNPIGELKFINKKKIVHSWFGFYDHQADSTITEFAYDWKCADTLFRSSPK